MPIDQLLFILILVFMATAIVSTFVFIVRRLVWKFALLFFIIDEFMWFLYNPLRSFMKSHKKKSTRFFWVLFTYLLIKPVWQISIFILTFPLRAITGLYADVLVYLSVMVSDTIEELFNPKLGSIRKTKGLKYLFLYIVLFPYRLIWFVVKNFLALIDSLLMFVVTLGFPTFTMYHGTKAEHSQDITQKGRWLVGTGNYAGSGIYFGRTIKTAKHYGSSNFIVSRVTFSLVRNCGTLPEDSRLNIGNMGKGGNKLAKQIKFPYVATELWRSGTDWWEYCLLQPGKEGKYISSWRIRPIGTVEVKGDEEFGGRLTRLWGGKSHYCLSIINIVMSVFAFISSFFLLIIWVFLTQ